MFEGARGRAVDLGYAAGWGLVKAVPGPVAKRSFRSVADMAFLNNTVGTQQLRANLRRVVGRGTSEGALDRLVVEAMRSYSRYWLETFRLEQMDHADVVARAGAGTTGLANLDAAKALGKGVVLALPHSGNWDVAGLFLTRSGYPFTTVAERLKPESLFDRFVAYRESLGMEVLPLTGGKRAPMEVLKERLRENGVVCLMADRDLSRSGVEVTFFGETTRMPPGPAMLSATLGAPLLPVHLWFTPKGWGQWVGPPIELPAEGGLRDRVASGTQQLATAFERRIALHPADWHMLQRLWLSDLPPRRSGTRAAGRR